MKKLLLSILVLSTLYSCTKPTDQPTPQPLVSPGNPELDAIVFDYNDGTADSVFQDSTGRIAKISFRGNSTVCEFVTTADGIAFTRKDAGVLQNFDTITYSGGNPLKLREYNNSMALVTVVNYKYAHGSDLSESTTTLGSGNIVTQFSYSGNKLTEMNKVNGYNVKYFYGNSPVANKLNAKVDMKNAYTVGAFATYRQVTDAMMYSSSLPDSIVYTNGASVFSYKVTYDTTSTGYVQNVYLNGAKKLTVAY